MSENRKFERWPQLEWAEVVDGDITDHLPKEVAEKFDAELGIIGLDGLSWYEKTRPGQLGYEMYRYHGRNALGCIAVGPSISNFEDWELTGYRFCADEGFDHIFTLAAADY